VPAPPPCDVVDAPPVLDMPPALDVPAAEVSSSPQLGTRANAASTASATLGRPRARGLCERMVLEVYAMLRRNT
jgi:hypothetical protein